MATQNEKDRLTRLETQMTNVEEKIDKMDFKLDKFIESAEKKYAGKWVEKVIIPVVISLLTALISIALIKPIK